ncbi:hypothetical protein, partial [Pseudanabaena sp. 'Roaring Creek']|uniref:hypothetical protein n=1 Tax=Pseudanabaena sp. 'Roaring Creek' TaxID=1681830 RepID=UPI0006D7AF78
RSPLVRYQQTAIAPSSPYNKAIAFTKYQKLRSPHNLPNHKAIAPSSPHQKAIASNQNQQPAIAPQLKSTTSDRLFTSPPQSDLLTY